MLAWATGQAARTSATGTVNQPKPGPLPAHMASTQEPVFAPATSAATNSTVASAMPRKGILNQ